MIGLAWIASSTWVVPVLGWHYLVFGGVRQNKVTFFFEDYFEKIPHSMNRPSHDNRRGNNPLSIKMIYDGRFIERGTALLCVCDQWRKITE